MKGIITDSFMLKNKTGERLYNTYAKDLPIIDYHCHLNPKFIAEDRVFKNVTELLLSEDHYKWRALRSNGVEEKYITGDGDDYTKFEKWCELLPMCMGNPLYAWNALEMKRYFDIDEPITPHNCKEVWDKCNALLASEGYSARGLIERSNVEAVCTTDDPMDDLRYHKQIREMGFKTKVLPTFRPDNAIEIMKPGFKAYVEKMGAKTFAEYIKVLLERMDFFGENGCLLSDHGISLLPVCDVKAATYEAAEKVFDRVMAGEILEQVEYDLFRAYVTVFCGKEYAKRGWTMQIHIGAIRNNNSRMFQSFGPDGGFDSMDDFPVAKTVNALLDAMDCEDLLPKTILYSLNPKDNYTLGTTIGNFQKAPVAGKIQLGPGWWFNDQRDGMEAQMQALANLGLISRFVGMLTDSRSFVSYPRHEYFRRIFCNLIGKWVEEGEYPEDEEYLEKIVKGVCYENAKKYFGF